MLELALTAGYARLFVGLGVVVWLVLAGCVASYGHDRGFPFLPLFICGVFLGFPLVLLFVTVAPRQG